MNAHEILGITLENLRKMKDEALDRAYQAKLQEIERIRENNEYNRRKLELDKAYAELEDARKRQTYCDNLLQPQPVMTSINTNVASVIMLSEQTTFEEINKTVETYQLYINSKINKLSKLDPSDENEKEKEKLEKYKQAALPQTERYSKFEDFQQSQHFQSMSEDQQQKYSKDNFPSQVKTVTLTFDSVEEALNYVKTNMSVEKARDLANRFQQKGLTINPEVLNDLQEANVSRISPNRRT